MFNRFPFLWCFCFAVVATVVVCLFVSKIKAGFFGYKDAVEKRPVSVYYNIKILRVNGVCYIRSIMASG